MKKLLVALALLTVSTVGYAIEVVPVVNATGYEMGSIFIVDGKKVYKCEHNGCILIDADYTRAKK